MIKIILSILLVLLSLILIPYSIYQFVIGLHYFKKQEKIKNTNKYNKFGILVAARNESNVIQNLIDSVNKLNYPKDKYELIIAPNNCTDDTIEIIKNNGIRVFNVKNPIRNKGDVLHQMFNYFLENENHDAFVIFDADNVIDKNFLIEMNKIIEQGYDVAQGFRDSKNPYESMTSGAYTLYHYMINLFYNKPRTTLKINNMIVGCGFMTTKNAVKVLGGWNTTTITEDLEFTVLSSIKGTRIVYSDDAIFYDEQPNSFLTSWQQRVRWSMGIKQGFGKNIKQVISEFKNKEKRRQLIDTLAMMSVQHISNLNLISMIAGNLLLGLNTTAKLGFTFLGINILGMIIGPSLFAIFILLLTERKILPMWKGILGFGIFLLSWIPINLYVTFKDNVEWKEIKRESRIEI